MPKLGTAAFLPLNGPRFELDAFDQDVVETVDKAITYDDVAHLCLHDVLNEWIPQRIRRKNAARVFLDRKQRATGSVALGQKQAVAIDRDRLRAGGVGVRFSRPWVLPKYFAVAHPVSGDPTFVDDDDLALAGECSHNRRRIARLA